MLPINLGDILARALPYIVALLLGFGVGIAMMTKLTSGTAVKLGEAKKALESCQTGVKVSADQAEFRAKQAEKALAEAQKGRGPASTEITRIRRVSPGDDACAASLKLNKDIVQKERGS